MTDQTEPTAEGLRRYPPTGHMTELREPIPCVCNETCHRLCAGECGCEACSVMFSIFCDEAGCFPNSKDELERALWKYRGDSPDP
jgi:hypothetical protein